MVRLKNLFYAALTIGLGITLGCNSRAKANAAVAKLERRVDLSQAAAWAKLIVESSDPAKQFQIQGSALPQSLLRTPTSQRPNANLVHFSTGEWIIELDSEMGLEHCGVALGRENAQFPPGYHVYKIKPGIYYFQSHL